MIFNITRNICETALVVDELPEIGKPFCCGPYIAARVLSLEPCPYTYPQDEHQEALQYAVWRVNYEPVSDPHDDYFYVAIHELESETM